MKWIFALAFASATRLRLSTKEAQNDLCGKGFENLNGGTQDYFNTVEKTLWTHPGNTDGFGVFKSELQCWFSRMINDDCGKLPPQPDRKKALFAECNDVNKDHLDIWHHFDDAEFKYFKSFFPSDPESDFSQSLTTMKDMNTKEVLCTTLFVIDDGCVAFKYVKKA